MHKAAKSLIFFGFLLCLCGALPVISHADTYQITPQTKLRVTVVQWVPLKGEYQRWDALSGDFAVSDSGEISLPLVGSIKVTDSSDTDLAAHISDLIKSKTGLIAPPNITIQILEYPPIYLVGGVTSPGAYPFRPGLTILQALALGGGRYRSPGTAEGSIQGQVGMLGEIKNIRDDILRTQGQIARLKAEAAGETEIHFPVELTSSENPLTNEIMAQEQVIFVARANALKRQLDNYSELQELLKGEIGVLGQKTEALEHNIKLVDDELTNVKALVDKGMATVSRRSELERAVAALQSNRLDEVTAAMRARQSLSEATRNGLSIRDKHFTDIALDLKEAQANLERFKVKEDVIEKSLTLGDFSALDARRKEVEEENLSFVIIRQTAGKSESFTAAESTPLLPGDVVKVTFGAPKGRDNDRSAGASATQ